MSNETMPEKIWVSNQKTTLRTAPQFDEFDVYLATETQEPTDVSYTRTGTIPDVAELQRQNAALKAFVRTIINENCFGCDGEVDGMDVQEEAVNSDIILPEIVTRKMLDEWERTDSYPAGDFAEGDTIFNFAPWMTDDTAAIPAPSKAERARELLKRVSDLLLHEPDPVPSEYLWAANQVNGQRYDAERKVLKEWEDAESK